MVREDFTSKIRSFWQLHQQWLIVGILTAILAAGAFLRLYHLGQAGVNEYYASAVKSMLQSWHNFFYVAFEPGGTVSVDKPPLGFWAEALSAYLFGFSGFSLALPNALAGILSIFVIYKLVRRPFGSWTGLAAAAVLAMMPVAVSTERNNTIDGMLAFVVLLAAWAFLQSVYSGKARWLFLGVLLVGLGFNIKMLQAFLPLPAFYALFFFGTKRQWLKKARYLAAATVLLLAVSFSWAMAVDLTPAENRPYVDSSANNSVMELIFGWNGLSRLSMSMGGSGMPQWGPQFGESNGSNTLQDIQPGSPQDQGFGTSAGNGSYSRQLLGGFAGPAGPLRLFRWPLVGEASWLLPFVLIGLIVLTVELWNRPFDEIRASFILWASWLLIGALFFSFMGMLHNYYLIMIGGPIAALTGMTLWALWMIIQRQWFYGWALAILLVGGTLVFEAYTLLGNTSLAIPAIEVAGILLSLGILAVITASWKTRFSSAPLGLLLAAMLVVPVVWSGLTTFNNSPSGMLTAGPTRAVSHNVSQRDESSAFRGSEVNKCLLNFLLDNTQPETYLFATGSANAAAGYILATGRPVLALGGFLDRYDEVPLDKFISLVKNGQLRFVLLDASPDSHKNQHKAIAQWVKLNFAVVNASAYGCAIGTAANNSNGTMSKSVLYQYRY